MRIARVKLTGFKSFVDPVELRILPGLTGIVGPNGCGKSNLLEAIRWAMGEGSPKSLRGAAMDDVIFAGTATRPQRQFAEVSILAERGAADGSGDDIEVVRRIERGAGSAYRINGRDARARDAQLIFADAATGAHSPALVSQGRIGAVIAAKPAERRAMLEEAAGIAGLHVRRREAEIRLKATEANLARVGELLGDMDARIAALRRQARSAERYRTLSGEIRTAEARLIFARWRDAAAAADVARAEAKAADEAVRAANEAQTGVAAWVREATAQLARLRTTAQGARDAASDARHKLATAHADRATLDARIAALTEQRTRLDADRAREGDLARDAGDALARLAQEDKALAARVADAKAERPDLVAALDRAERDARAADVALAQALAAQARHDAERRVADAALAAARLVLTRAVGDRDRLRAELARLPTRDAAHAASDAAAQARMAAETAMTRAVADLAANEAARAAATEAVSASETELATVRARLAALESEAVSLAEPPGSGSTALDRVTVAPGYEAALAAALSDDLGADIGSASSSARRWAGAGATGDPKLVAGPALANHVSAPPELARRLAQIGVVDVDDGQPLAVGQRIVTRDGRMRRWDGFIAEGVGGAASETLKRRNRFAALETMLPGARGDRDKAQAAVATARDAQKAIETDLATARRAREAADSALRSALRAEDAARAEAERTVQRHDDIAARLADSDAQLSAANDAVSAAENARVALPEAEGDDTVLLERAAATCRTQTAQLRSDLAARDAALKSDEARIVAARAEAEGWRSRSGAAGKRVADMAKRAAALDAEAEALTDAPDSLARTIRTLERETAALAEASDAAIVAEREAEGVLRMREGDAARAAETLAAARETRAGAQARAEDQELRRVEMGRVSGERFECPPPLLPERQGFAPENVGATSDESARLERLTLDRERLGPVNLVAESELAEIESVRAESACEHNELTEATHRLRGSIGSLNREGRAKLRAAFETVDGHFRVLFKTLFNGGKARLEMIDSDDPLDPGLEILAQPPGKKLTSLSLLSGGEQALTAVALIFGLFLTNPAPLCVLDEVDAPLDDANVERFCDLLDAMAKDTATRYLIVTHNAVTMARMHRLYGVTMVEQGISRLVSVDLGGAQELLAAE